MFGFSWFKLIVAAAVALIIYLGYQYVVGLQEQITVLATDLATEKANVVALKDAVETQKQTIAALERDNQLRETVLQDTFERFQQERDRTEALEKSLEKHDLGFLASNKPGLVENIINKATDNIGRCFEIASGSPLTIDEVNATKPSEINSECPDLANPNYSGAQ